ncbi:hypothetical protein WL04_09025 [Burkholderia ubonensis]|uniref:hypothetical protein n=1 Tax=Burkholderia ubonensis TaxID=101571 RepID=UPI000756308A|nr:hypothetical protein [Burkholderia ubonensis]KVX39867.1 hypothetical protein WL04_09025 [Burkholderia ubonensis]KWO61692.1 hypothetical protein WM30_10915 [Burkholderia ubonensis]
MYYWNQRNFEGLLKLAEAFDACPELKPLADYCRFREQGLRRYAFAALERFLDASRSFDSTTARRAAIDILEANARTSEAHQFLAQPLTARFLLPTLQTWMHEEPDANLPVRWLGILERDDALLAGALAMCPDDMPVRKMLIGHALDSVDFATHHLDESCFIGSVDHALAKLERARRLIADAPDAAAFARLASEVDHFAQLVADWQAWSRNPVGSFPEWCAAQGRDYRYAVKIYYSQS